MADSVAAVPPGSKRISDSGAIGSGRSGGPGRRLDKLLGQHHLVDGALARPLVGFLRPAGERVVEIGPGGGALTAELLAAGAERVFGWELDPGWAAELARRLADPRLVPVVGDALDFDWRRLPRLAGSGGEAAAGSEAEPVTGSARGSAHRSVPGPGPRPLLVCGNLPYNVGTALIERLLTGADPGSVPRAAFLVQKEVAERLVARPGDPAYGGLSVLVAAHAEARLLGRLRPGSFRPPPRVDSAFVGLTLRPPPLPRGEMPAFLATVRAAFAQRRKTLRNSLAASWGRPAAETALAAAGLDPGTRAERLGLDDFLALHRARPSPPRKPPAPGS
jgi:16S rRNA (adenine1518-N6/adenine1519-N6)-dimethyltransferase